MLEIMIECWRNLDGSTDHFWSLWRDGRRLHMSDKLESPDVAEVEALEFCRRSLGAEPDRVTRL